MVAATVAAFGIAGCGRGSKISTKTTVAPSEKPVIKDATREELLDQGPAEFSPALQPDERRSDQAFAEQVARTLEKGRSWFEWVHRNSQGDEIPCEIHLVSLPYTSRPLIRGSILDISERRRSEAALRESEARYKSLVNNARYGIYWVNLESDLLHVNPALVQMLGYESAEQLLAATNWLPRKMRRGRTG